MIQNKPKALNQGEITIGNMNLACAVLDNSERVISIRGLANYLGVKGGGAYWEKKKKSDAVVLPEFVSAGYLAPYITDEVKDLLTNTVLYTALNGQPAEGIRGKILPKICDVWIKALNGGSLNIRQKQIAERAYQLLGAFAEIGITALIDEATGYQKAKNEYQKILELYIAKEMRPWIMTFDDSFYIELYRLLGWTWDAYKMKKKQHPLYIGKLTNRLVYEKLAPGVLQELQKINPKNEKGRRKTKHHQHLTENVGYRELLKLITAVTILMEQFPNGDLTAAIQKIDSRFPSFSPFYQTSMDFPAVANKQVFDTAIKEASKPVKALDGKAE
ncbi:MAG: P63C domain-containing protein [Candidatus Shapirobacteria bacterium]